jgi:hypothetical protein
MGLQAENEFCQRLSLLTPEKIGEQWNLLSAILGRLHESHTDSFYDMTKDDDFSWFAEWAKMLAKAPGNSEHAAELLGIADLFLVRP